MESFLQKMKNIIKMFLFYILIYFVSLILSSIFNIHVAYVYFSLLILSYLLNQHKQNLFKH
ncbi:hypothetical protein DRF63_08595 [Actinobacillus pleuropneumoniae]|uniref:Uncharacterized protein n=1 Tax=Actinobacillus pleuropneumoniae TaxID=715 RepID=A0ABM6X6S0_ACTPL|nr:hypothetical protein APPSER1_08600 [Actinobacillus pleuropneumoniae serovar 1 str. 4074]AXA22059.1 hypothetical protein DRF63_08595 [Actinobacillus pleuropneumoniae]UKH31381.1 hypothetical protein D1104_08670 [Actinobacillus pleuropneumoniae serovar 11 str. 56153]UKH33420.1 hypothetical protein D1103_08420 [Actinobacillus pleuropneumoniae serovar 10 str. D13039]UKH35770.1 hypothetical protein D1102_09990 [Actinobacillus pleuropneumoniae serovar 9 str. CVJ13261]UKH37607.1 hypothetical protei